MKTKVITFAICLLIFGFSVQSCKKLLDEKPDDKIATVATLGDAQRLLDYYAQMNMNYPYNLETQSDNYYLTPTDYNSRNPYEKAVHTWQKNESTAAEWSGSYASVLYCNTVLAAYDNIMRGNKESMESRNVLGSAIFFRAYYLNGIAQLYAPVYDQATASTDMGIPIRVDADFEVNSKRATVSETYNFIISEFKKAAQLLPVNPLVKSRPGKPATYGALARVYLSMGDYNNAGLYADSCLQLTNELIDFNTLSKTSATPFTRFNKEVVFHIRSAINATAIAPLRAKITKELYDSYDNNDLRKVIYFRANTGANAGTFNFKGNYDEQGTTATGFVFGGIVTDEMYLIRAESQARAGSTSLAMNDLNTLLKTRWAGTYIPLVAADAADALKIILRERRKELLYRGTRWTDLRRLSKEAAHAVVPKRVLGPEVYELQPESLRYVLAFPADVIRLSGMPQNP